MAGQPQLLDFDFGAGVFELLLDRRRFRPCSRPSLDGLLGAPVHQILGFLQAQAGKLRRNRLDDVDLVAAHVGENNGEFRLLFPAGAAPRRCSAATRKLPWPLPRKQPNASSHLLNQIRRLQQRQPLDFLPESYPLSP